jgi:hypothetical protein
MTSGQSRTAAAMREAINYQKLWRDLSRPAGNRSNRVPVRFGVSDHRLWVQREIHHPGGVFNRSLERATADKILSTLLAELEEAVAACGGTVGLLVGPGERPREIPFGHGALALDLPADP